MLDLQLPHSAAAADAAGTPTLPAPTAPRLDVSWARHADEVRQAQALRWQVFAGEMGAQLCPPPGTAPGLDVDRFDAHCEHLLVRCHDQPGHPARVVGTYRVLTPAAARQAGGLYSEGEFDLGPLGAQRHRMAELGRSCVHADFRQGAVILMLWGSLLAFLRANGLDLAIGCASVPMRDGGHAAASLWRQLSQTHLAPPALRVQPRLALPVADLRQDLAVEPPPLVKGYLRCGAQLLGAPAWDPDFGVADLPLLLNLADMPAAYRRRFGV